MKADKLLCALSGFLLMVSLLLTVVDGLCFRRSFYEYEYSKNNSAEYIGMSDEGIMAATDTLLDYLRDKRDDIVVETEVSGYMREVFNERETLHMIDVKNLYANAVTARNIMAETGILILAGLLLWKKKMPLTILKQTYLYGLLLLGVIVAVIAVYALADFTEFWLQFHYIFFDNDLFILDPNTSIMINMFPETFFSDLVFRIIGVFGGCALLAGAAVLIPYNRKMKETL